jgi:hypothetical protein
MEETNVQQANAIASALQRGERWAIIAKERSNAKAELILQFTEQVNRLHRYALSRSTF